MTSPKLRLIELSEAFRGVDAFRLFGWSNEYGNKMLSNWVKQGVLERLGPRLDIYVQCGRVPKGMRRAKMLEAFTSGHFRADPGVLRAYGWTTQIAQTQQEFIPSLAKNCQPQKDLQLFARSRRWWNMMAPGYIGSDQNEQGLGYHIRPHWLLAEAAYQRSNELWSPDEDDIDFDSMSMDISLNDFYVAFSAVAKYYGAPEMIKCDTFEEMYAQAKNAILVKNPTQGDELCL